MVDWVCWSLGGGLILRLHLTTLLRRLGLQITLFSHDGSGHTEMFWLQFSIVEGSGDASSIFFLQSMAVVLNLFFPTGPHNGPSACLTGRTHVIDILRHQYKPTRFIILFIA